MRVGNRSERKGAHAMVAPETCQEAKVARPWSGRSCRNSPLQRGPNLGAQVSPASPRCEASLRGLARLGLNL